LFVGVQAVMMQALMWI